jgi:hypothetical protein
VAPASTPHSQLLLGDNLNPPLAITTAAALARAMLLLLLLLLLVPLLPLSPCSCSIN